MRDENVDAQRQDPEAASASPADMQAALFAQLVMQQANMAMMLMGRSPNPQTGESMKDLEAARFFVDTVEMLETKTKGNLSKEESGLLKQTLMTLRLAYVEAVNEGTETKPATSGSTAATQPATSAPPQPSAPAQGTTPAETGAASEEESRKKFSKKY
jgi:hypothetical protein